MRARPLSAATPALLVLALILFAPATALAAPALSPANMDTTCSPCRDFFRYANGRWLDTATIPAAYPSWGSFEELAERNQEALRAILERAAADTLAAPGSDTERLGTAWCAS